MLISINYKIIKVYEVKLSCNHVAIKVFIALFRVFLSPLVYIGMENQTNKYFIYFVNLDILNKNHELKYLNQMLKVLIKRIYLWKRIVTPLINIFT